MTAATARDRSLLRYHGGKWRIAPWILSHLPEHTCYVEPFAGSMAVLLQKRPSFAEVANDKSKRVVNFFRVLRERQDALIRAIELTPYARAEFELARQPCDDELEAARRFYVLSWQGRGGPTARWNTSWSFHRQDLRSSSRVNDWNKVDHLWALVARLKLVQLECGDAADVIRRFDAPDTLFYVDPPYLRSTRSKWAGIKNGAAYDHELCEDAEHQELAALLQSVKGMVAISGYPSPLYDRLYAGWQQTLCRTRTDRGTAATECLWLSSAAAARAPQRAFMFGEE